MLCSEDVNRSVLPNEDVDAMLTAAGTVIVEAEGTLGGVEVEG